MNSKVTIYKLIDPRNNECFYIGKSIDIERRYYNHIRNIDEPNLHKKNKINEIKKLGLKPILETIIIITDYYDKSLLTEDTPTHWWEYVEQFYIRYYRDILNQPLTNIEKGGGLCPDKSKRVHQFSKEGTYINSFKSAAEAGRVLSINYSNIIQTCNGRYKSSGGYQWCYSGDENNIKSYQTICTKSILQYSVDNVFIKRYISISDAAKETNTNPNNIISCCKNKKWRKTAGGYKWQYDNGDFV